MTRSPVVSVLMAAHDAAEFLRPAVRSLLRQSFDDFELLVVDDCSSDATPTVLASFDDARLRVVRNEAQLGLAASLNVGLDRARGRYIARLDADDVAVPVRLERQLDLLRRDASIGIVGSAVIEIDEAGRLGRLHRHPRGPAAVRWHALFSSPFFHPSVMLDRDLLERHRLRYDAGYGESEDYELWSRLLSVADGDNSPEPLILYRTHPGQASQRRRELQRDLQRRVALRAIAAVAPDLDEGEAELAWCLGAGRALDRSVRRPAIEAFTRLLARFEAVHGRDARVRRAAAGALARRGAFGRAVGLDVLLPAKLTRERLRRRSSARDARRQALAALAAVDARRRVRVVVVSPEPTPYRSPVFDRLARRPELDLHVIYAGRTIAGRKWTTEQHHSAEFVEGVRVPGVERVFRHEYPMNAGVFRSLPRARPEVVVVSGWSTFASQAAVVWCRAKRVPYVLLVESHDVGPRARWRRAVKAAVVPPIVKGAARVLVVGSLARESMIARGAQPGHVSVFANTVDVPAFVERAAELAPHRDSHRADLGAGGDDVVVLSVARLAAEKGLDTLLRATAATAEARLLVAVAGEGPERERLAELARELGIRLRLLGNLRWERIVEAYVAADVFALLSLHEPWGVVVNEAAACALPLVLSDRVGAAADLLVDGQNGFLVGAGDVAGTAEAIGRLARDPGLREAAGARSRELMQAWGYEPSIENFVVAVRDAAVSA